VSGLAFRQIRRSRNKSAVALKVCLIARPDTALLIARPDTALKAACSVRIGGDTLSRAWQLATMRSNTTIAGASLR